MLDLCCRPEMVVGWYHSHPGFGCWLSGVDINTQQVQLHFFLSCLLILVFLHIVSVSTSQLKGFVWWVMIMIFLVFDIVD